MHNTFEVFCLFDFIYPYKKKLNNKQAYYSRLYINIVLLLLINCLSFGLVWLQDYKVAQSSFFYIPLISFAAEFIIILYVYDSKHFYIEKANMLFKQIKKTESNDNNLRSVFDYWYIEKHLKPMYGFIDYSERTLNCSFKNDISSWLFMILFIFIWMSFAMFFPNLPIASVLEWLGRFINAFVYWVIVSYALRIIFLSVRIIKDYENDNWEISTPFSRFNNSGFNFLVKSWRKTMFYFLPFWIFFWLYVSTAYLHDFWLDTIYVVSALGLVGIWSIRTTGQTIMLSRKIRRDSIINFETTILEQRDAFTRDLSLFRFLDLNRSIKTYKEYEKIMLKDFNKASYITTVILNLWVLFIPLLYWLHFCLPVIT